MASKNISISLPEVMIEQATQLARREQRTLSELFREAFRVYRAQQMKNAQGKEQELNRIANQIRAELESESREH